MKHSIPLPWVLFFGVLALASPGCGNKTTTAIKESAVRSFELDEIWQMYKLHTSEKKHAPARLADLQQYSQAFVNGFQALQSGQCVVFWGADLSRTPDAGRAVLAYAKDVPTQGGPVLMADGTVKTMTAE